MASLKEVTVAVAVAVVPAGELQLTRRCLLGTDVCTALRKSTSCMPGTIHCRSRRIVCRPRLPASGSRKGDVGSVVCGFYGRSDNVHATRR